MPKIAELREIDGALWAKLEISGDHGSVAIYTPEEIEWVKRDAVRAFQEQLAEDIKNATGGK